MAPPWSPGRLAASGLLMLTPWMSTVTAEPTAADYFVHSLPGAPEPLVKMHAGHVEITPEHNGNLFFWHFENQHIANKQRTVIWLNGGPGCSSEDGVMMEIGPYRMKDADTLQYNNGSWNEYANLLFVDNPVGTGYSYVDTNSYIHELDEMADQFVLFLEKWYTLFPQYENDDIYIAGESYAGQHIPYIAKAMLARNKKPGTKHVWNLKGVLIGNGWISPVEQYDSYLAFGYEKGIIKKGSDVSKQLESQYRTCQKEMASFGSKEVDNAACESVLQEMLRLTQTMGPDGKKQCINMYDVRLTDEYPSCGMNWPPDLKYVTPYLRKAEVTEALHISSNKNTGWTECNGAVGAAFRASNSAPSIDFLPDLLSEIDVLLFSGAEDLICNHLGTEALISNMNWNGGKGFEVSPGNWAPRRDWTFEGEAAGFWQEARNLTYVLFYNSSHMVPFDYARRTRDMLDRFVKVDISSIGGVASESMLDGEKLPDTTVSGATNNTATDQAVKDKELEEAKWFAYRKSGEMVLAIVIIAAAVWGFFVWRGRRRVQGYEGLATLAERAPGPQVRMGRFRNTRSNRDVEAGDFDESEREELHVTTPTVDNERYSVGGDSDDEVVTEKPKAGQSSSS
ncbi:pheromone-processing carboxypeptidase KEX1 [Pseudomassariella vexata]|uniref:Carboxypeptidase n=1 Tax=Pseudomassariella vexata TaxID=1141098 RepID=A0A1Y2DV36_9PEZI|nr:pheromone-processing carboxypeptidase KEX1 [Pseudomassariella vexata]ORY62994.1 pheromone-processing carboxypeptidase KEX1 [Pseudomassariella vexata]